MLSKLHQRHNDTGRFKIQAVNGMQIALQNGNQRIQGIQIGAPCTNRHQRCLLYTSQYSYLKDEKKKKEHLQAASKDLKGTPYEMKINQLMKK